MSKIFSSLGIAALAVAVSTPAAAIVVGGINFGSLGNTVHIETATLAETFVNGVGQSLQGYGLISTVNGSSSYCDVGACSLYYKFSGYTVSSFNGIQVQFTGGVIDIFRKVGAPLNLFDQNSFQNFNTVIGGVGMTPWARLIGHTFSDPIFLGTGVLPTQTLNGEGSLTGASITQNGRGQVDVDTSNAFGLTAVSSYLNGNSIGDNLGGFADIVLTSSSNNFVLNPLDVSGGLANGCSDGTALAGAWCLQGTLNTRGAVALIPEPTALALVGIALAGAGLARRRKK